MPIIQRLHALPNPPIASSPGLRRCILCNRFGVYRHGSRVRLPSPGESNSEPIDVPRMICQCCRRTFSILPRFVLRRVRASLSLLLGMTQTGTSWMQLFHQLGVAWNTIHAWKKLGKVLVEKLPVWLETVATWAELSTHLSRWQYPNFRQRMNSTLL
jgi:transposase-like protein